jgi:serine/threonine protein kinase
MAQLLGPPAATAQTLLPLAIPPSTRLSPPPPPLLSHTHSTLPLQVGTLAYMDPEYLRSGCFGPKSDVYSLGMVILQLLTGAGATGGCRAACGRGSAACPWGLLA